MLLKKLKLKNFARFSEAELDLQDYNKALIVGIINNDAGDSNGSGKTSLIDAIGWCVWGESKAKTVDENVKLRTTICTVYLEFEHDGRECSISRTRDKHKGLTLINFYIDGVLSNGKTVTDTNKKIVAFLRLDYATFVNSVYLRQDDIFSFADGGTNKEGRDILEKVLGLEEYDLYQDEAKASVKKIEREIEAIRASMGVNADVDEKIKDAESKLESGRVNHTLLTERESQKIKEIADAKKLVSSLQAEKEEFQKTQFGIREMEILVESQKNEVNSLIRKFNADTELNKTRLAELQLAANRLPSVQERAKTHEESIAANNITKSDIEKVEAQISSEKAINAAATERFLAVSPDVKSIERQIAENTTNCASKTRRMKHGPDADDVCPECLTEITEDTVSHFKDHLSKEITALSTSIDGLTKDLEAKKGEQSIAAAEMSRSMDEVSNLETKKSTLSRTLLSDSQIEERASAIARDIDVCAKAQQDLDTMNISNPLEALRIEVESKKAEYLAKKQELEVKLTEYPKVQFDTDKITQAESLATTLDNEINAIRQSIHILVAEIKNYEASIKSFDIIKDELETNKALIEVKKSDLSMFMRLQEAFSSKGIRADILQNAIAELEKHSNELLGRLTSGRLSVEFKTKKEVKASRGEQVEKVVFEVIVNDGEDPLPFHLYSGGEKFRVAFVLRVALAQLLQRRANSKLEFLIIDEAFSPLDRNGIEKNLAVIDMLQNEFKTILVITHRDDIKQYFDQVITVMRDADGSRLL